MKKNLILLCFIGASSFTIAQNVGIGTADPLFKLDVRNGSINTDSVYRIKANTVLSVSGNGNLFIGKDAGKINTNGFWNTFSGDHAGNVNTTGNYNSFFGESAGLSNTSGIGNSFFGLWTGKANTTGEYNSIFGYVAGLSNTTGMSNSFFGDAAGYNNSEGNFNSFYGTGAGYFNTTGNDNSFFGKSAGLYTTVGSDNSFFGRFAGFNNTIGYANCFFGVQAGISNGAGTFNTAVGNNANVSTTGLTNATALGAKARVDCSNCLVLGSILEINGANATVNVGIGTSNPNPAYRLDIAGRMRIRSGGDLNSSAGVALNNIANSSTPAFIGMVNDDYIGMYGYNGAGWHFRMNVTTGNVAIGAADPTEKLTVYGNICASGTIGTCSDIRYKKNLAELSNSLTKVLKMQGYYYFWKQDLFSEKVFSEKRQIGFSAQEIENLFPEVVQTDANGYKSVDYGRMTPVLVEAIKEQQKEIDILQKNIKEQQQQIDDQQKQIEELKKVVGKIVNQ